MMVLSYANQLILIILIQVLLDQLLNEKIKAQQD